MAKKKNKEQAKAKNQLKDLEKSQKKQKKKNANPDDDIDKILAELKKDQQIKYQITEEQNVQPPSRRANATFTPHPNNQNELILFGGEFYDNQKVYMYNDLYRYKIDKNEWTKITSPNSPGPRSSHQIVASSNGILFLFGGEFVSPNETNFFHYKDFWSFDLKTNAWEKLELTQRPSPRSGHRMTSWKHYLILFGGFYDIGVDVRYYDDFWFFDTKKHKWQKIDITQNDKPGARSGFQMFMHNDYLYLYGTTAIADDDFIGGYCKLNKGKSSKGLVHTDIWCIKLTLDFKNMKWEKKKRVGVYPESGFAMVYHKGRAVLFGGVTDIDESDDGIKSICHGDMFNFNIDGNRWFPFTLKQVKKDDAVLLPQPCPRFNAMTAVIKNTLFVFGGIVEAGSKEHTLNDLWSVQLDKMLSWTPIIEDDISHIDWKAIESENESDNDDDSISSDSESDCESANGSSNISSSEELVEYEMLSDVDQQEISDALALQKLIDSNIAPLPGEKLGQYFSRTIKHWEGVAFAKKFNTGKLLRKEAFDLAQIKYQDYIETFGDIAEMQIEDVDLQLRKDSTSIGTLRPRR